MTKQDNQDKWEEKYLGHDGLCRGYHSLTCTEVHEMVAKAKQEVIERIEKELDKFEHNSIRVSITWDQWNNLKRTLK